ncbi:uncharacterized protein LOC106157206 [Lingula anatina]|uniref:Uncharacterized protein LOC106157206 n=1 Tax=Lingula anatina TaxID=7574 RepID=A0A1S3HQA5_LINAN|nr:uncharacterized protein LOC106157206 [Lingula anatina]|eukprot:XP_013388238.1 uncharacterized protein LOC106157206 [Lingula anatina]
MHNVPIGFPHFISRMFCQCKLAKEPGCSSFCRSSVWGCLPNTDEIYCTWLHVGKCLGIMILVACALPLPFIIRLGLYFLYEQDEVLLRKAALHSLHLHENYEENLLQYLTPFHPALVCAYLFYFLCCTVYCLAYNNVRGTGMVRRIVKTSFEDLMGIKYGQVLQRLVAVVLLPLERFGVCGFLFGLLYWPVVVPVCLIMVPFYCLPTLYLSIRMLFNSQMSLQRFRSKPDQDKGQRFERPSGSQLKRNLVHGMKRVHNLLGNMNITHNDSEHHHKYRPHVRDMSCYGRTRKIVLHLAAAFVCICFLYSVLIMLAESAYLGTEVFALTLMGAIINAGTTLKFLSLVALIVLYAYDALNDVYKTYLELNQSIVTTVYNLANEVAYGGIEQGSWETNKPRTAFQLNLAEHKVGKRESYQPDGLSTKGSRRNHYHVNNLCLLMDSNDTARIPIDLFYRMCEIDISHSPGPIERRVWGALGYLFLITLFIGFVFIVVGTFGNLYNISTTNQTLASLAGGALPFFLRSFCKPPKLDGSYKTAISFRRRFDETIATYSQSWPIADLDVTEVKEPEDGSCSEWAPICYVDSAVAVQETGAPVPMKELVVEQKPSNLFDRLTDAIRSGLGSRGSLDSISSSDDDGKSNSLLAFSGVSSVADITSGENGVIFDFADGSVTMVDSRPDILIKIDKRTLAKLNGNHPDVKRKLRHHYDEIDLGNSDDVRTFNKISDNNDCVSNESEGTDL